MYKLIDIQEINQQENLLNMQAPQMSTDICGAAYSQLMQYSQPMGTGPATNMNIGHGGGTTYFGSGDLFIQAHLSLIMGDTNPNPEATTSTNFAGGVAQYGHSANNRRIVYATNDRIAIYHSLNGIGAGVSTPFQYSTLALPLYNSNNYEVNIQLDTVWSNRNEQGAYGGCYVVTPHYINDYFVDYCAYDMLAYYSGNTYNNTVKLYITIPAKTTIILVNATQAFYDASNAMYHTTGFFNLGRLGTTYPGVVCDTRMLEVIAKGKSTLLQGSSVSGCQQFEILYNLMHKWYGVENARVYE